MALVLLSLIGCDNPAINTDSDSPVVWTQVKGRIVNGTTGQKLRFGQVHLLPSDRIAGIDTAGFFFFDSLESGPVRFVVESPFYKSETFEILVQPDSINRIACSLQVELNLDDLLSGPEDESPPYRIEQSFLRNNAGTVPSDPLVNELGPVFYPQPLSGNVSAFTLRDMNLYFQNNRPPTLLLYYGVPTSCDEDVFGLGLSNRIWKRLGQEPPSWAGCYQEPSTLIKELSGLDLQIGASLAISDSLLIFGGTDIRIQPFSLNPDIYSVMPETFGGIPSIASANDSLWITFECYSVSGGIETWTYRADVFTTDEDYRKSIAAIDLTENYHIQDLAYSNGRFYFLSADNGKQLLVYSSPDQRMGEFGLPANTKKINVIEDTLWVLASEWFPEVDQQQLTFYKIDLPGSMAQSENLVLDSLSDVFLNTGNPVNFDVGNRHLWVSEERKILEISFQGDLQRQFLLPVKSIRDFSIKADYFWVAHNGITGLPGYVSLITKFRFP